MHKSLTSFANRMTQTMRIVISATAIAVCLFAVGCSKDEPDPNPPATATDRTIIVYMPWSGTLTSYLRANVDEIEDVLSSLRPQKERVVVYFAESSTRAQMFEITTDASGTTSRKALRDFEYTYTSGTPMRYTTAEGIAEVLSEAKKAAPANKYAMIMGCHGLGWIPRNYNQPSATPGTVASADEQRPHWETPGVPLTRFFGGTSSETRADIAALVEGLTKADIKLEYMLLDLCYMANVEVAYALRNSVGVLIASPTEIMAYGMPYSQVLPKLLGTPDYAGAVEAFYNFYKSSSDPYGALTAIRCADTEEIAAKMKAFNSKHVAILQSKLAQVQTTDGYRPTIFYDLCSFAREIGTDDAADVVNAVSKALIAERHTERIYTMNKGAIEVQTLCGLTISDPSTNSMAARKRETAWYEATHGN